MSLKNKLNMKKAIIVFPIIFVLVASSLIGVFSLGFIGGAKSEDMIGENLEDAVSDERALKIYDIYDDIDKYLDKEITLEGYLLKYDDKTQVFGVEFPLSSGELSIAALSYEAKDPKIIDGISDTDLIKAKGTIKTFEEKHEDHTDTIPKFVINSIEVIR